MPVRRAAALLLALLALPLAGCLEDGWRSPQPGAGEALLVVVEGPDAVLVGDVATLTARAEGVPEGTAFWFWDFGDGVEHEDVGLTTVEHEFADAGARTVTVTVVDAAGRRGVATHHVAVNQAYEVEGTVSRGALLGVGDAPSSTAFPVEAGLAMVRLDVALERASPLPVVGDAAPARVLVRLLAPQNAEAGGAEEVVFEARVSVGSDGDALSADVPGDRVLGAGDVLLEVTAEEGVARFAAALSFEYLVPPA